MRIISNQSIVRNLCQRVCVFVPVFLCVCDVQCTSLAIYWSFQSEYFIQFLYFSFLLWVKTYFAFWLALFIRSTFNQTFERQASAFQHHRYLHRRSNVYWKFNNNYLIVMNWQELVDEFERSERIRTELNGAAWVRWVKYASAIKSNTIRWLFDWNFNAETFFK